MKVPTPTCHDTPENIFPVPEISSESTKMSRQGIPKFRKTATLVPLMTQSQNRGPPMEDSLGELFVRGTTLNSIICFCEI